MAVHIHKEAATVLLVALLLILLPAAQSSIFNRTSFPPDFIFGASSASYQYEGAAFEDGKGRSIWDTFVHQFPGKITNRDNGDVADNFYHLYKEDVKLMDYIGLDAFRFSISWPRILSSGKLSDGVNKAGVAFYNNLIDELLSKGIKPFVTIFHWDLPQALEDEYGGFLHRNIIKDFKDFAEVCFKEFGDRVKYWATINEPYIFVKDGYDGGNKAPGRCSAWKNNNCPAGNSATEPYIVAHNLILCHAATVKLYKEKYQASQKGVIGMTQVSNWMVPYTPSSGPAAQRALDFMFGWYMDPLAYGDYPESMRKLVQKRLPKFSPEEAKMVKGSYDYIGINYYSSNYAAEMAPGKVNRVNVSSSSDSQVNLTTSRNGKPIGPPTDVSIFFVYPKGLRDLLVYMKEKYNNPIIYIHENGYGEIDNGIVKKGVNDPARVSFYYRHILAVKQAMKKGVNVKGFFPWSFLDTFEWGHGFSHRFGINYVDYKDGLKRYPKKSALWFKKFLGKH